MGQAKQRQGSELRKTSLDAWAGVREELNMSKARIISEFFFFMKESKKWWLFPIVLVLLLLGALLVLTQGSALAPFIYTLF